MIMKLNPAEGLRDFKPEEYFKREYLIEKIQEVFKKYGFLPIDTPVMERKEILEGKSGEETEKLIFRIQKRGDKLKKALKDEENLPSNLSDLALRYDLTVPLARFYARNRNDLPRIFKRYHIAPVWRAERAQVGRYRELYQCDVDVIGSGSPFIEAEVILVVAEILSNLGFKEFTVRINDRRLLKALMKAVNIPTDLHDKILITIDKLDKIGLDGVKIELAERGLKENTIQELIKTINELGKEKNSLKAIEAAEKFLKNHLDEEENIFEHLKKIVETISLVGFTSGNFEFDPFLVRGMAYYTGPIFEISSPVVPFSIAGGGRFDNLIENLSGQKAPACGFSIGFERILLIMNEQNMFPENLGKIDVFIPLFSEDFFVEALKLANSLRTHGLTVEVFPEALKINKQMKIANKKGVSNVIFLGEDEIKSKKINVKNMGTGESQDFTDVKKCVEWIQSNKN